MTWPIDCTIAFCHIGEEVDKHGFGALVLSKQLGDISKLRELRL